MIPPKPTGHNALPNDISGTGHTEQQSPETHAGRKVSTSPSMPSMQKNTTPRQNQPLHNRTATIPGQETPSEINKFQDNYSVDGSAHAFLTSLNTAGDTGNQFNILFVPRDGGDPISFEDFHKPGNEEILKNYKKQISQLSQDRSSISCGLMENMAKTQQKIANIVTQQYMTEQATGQISQNMGALLEAMQYPVVQPKPVPLSYLLGFSGTPTSGQTNNPMMQSNHGLGGQPPAFWGSLPNPQQQPFNYPIPQQAGFHAMPPPPPQGMGLKVPFSPYGHHMQQHPVNSQTGLLSQLQGFAQAPTHSLIPMSPIPQTSQLTIPQPVVINVNNDQPKKNVEHKTFISPNPSRIDKLTEELKKENEDILDNLKKIQNLLNERNTSTKETNKNTESNNNDELLINDIANLKQDIENLKDKISQLNINVHIDNNPHKKEVNEELDPKGINNFTTHQDVKDEDDTPKTDLDKQTTVMKNSSMGTGDDDNIYLENAQHEANSLLNIMVTKLITPNSTVEEKNKIKEDISSLKERLKEEKFISSDDVNSIIEPLEKTYDHLTNNQNNIDEIQERNDAITSKNNELQKQINKLSSESQNTIKSLESEKEAMKNENKNLNNKNTDLEMRNKEIQNDITRLQMEIDEQSKNTSKVIETAINEHKDKSKEVENEIGKLHEKVNEILRENKINTENADNYITKVKKGIMNIRTNIREKEEEIIRNHPTLKAEVKERINTLLKSCEEINDHFGGFTASLGEKAREITQKQTTINELENKLETIKKLRPRKNNNTET